MTMKQLKIDPELRDLLPPLTPEEYAQLENNILTNGYDRNFPIMEWNGYIVDGHNRYQICQDNNITDYVVGTLAYETKEEVIEWMLGIQLGRRNLSPMQRISIAEKYRGIYEKQAKENKSANGGDKKSDEYKKTVMANLPEANSDDKKEPNPTTRKKLADLAGVGERTYAKGVAILNSGNEELKKRVLSGETKIDAGYKELTGKNKKQSVSGDSESSVNNAPLTFTERIQSIDEQVKRLEQEIKHMEQESQELLKQRMELFSSEEVEGVIKYRLNDDGVFYNTEIYLEVDGHSTTLFSGGMHREMPDAYDAQKVPEQYKYDFWMIWKAAYREIAELKAKREEQWNNYDEQWQKFTGAVVDYANGLKDIDKSHLKKFYRVLVERFHPDNGNGDVEMMQSVNKLKQLWDL